MSSPGRNGSVDFGYLEGFLSGDRAVVLEVLGLFRGQTAKWAEQLAARQEIREVAHTIKGAARGIGAHALGDAADKAEFGVEADVPPLLVELDRAVEDIDAYCAEPS